MENKSYENPVEVQEDGTGVAPSHLRHPSTGALVAWEDAKRLPREVQVRMCYLAVFKNGQKHVRWPFVGESYNFSDPTMPRAELASLGMSDEELTREHAKIAAHEIGDRDLRTEDPDTSERQAKRFRWYEELTAALYR